MLNVKCPSCEHLFEVDADKIGQHAHCPRCNHRMAIHESHAGPFVRPRISSPLLILVFFLIIIAILAGIAVTVVRLIGPAFQEGL